LKIHTNLGIFWTSKRETTAADDAELITMISGIGYSISAITELPMVMILAKMLQYPNTLAAKIAGISSILAIKLILKAELIPNLDAIMSMRI
jgi:hypothetical protein